jgi:hypothetical protein
MGVKFVIRNLDGVQAYLKTVPRGALREALKAFVTYVIGNSSHGLRHDEPQRYVSRKAAGYKTSRKQIAFMIATGILVPDGQGGFNLNRYKRTGETAASWSFTPTNGGYNYTLKNPKAGAYWTRDEANQTRQHQMAGRRKISKVIVDNLAGAMRAANAAVKRVLGNK